MLPENKIQDLLENRDATEYSEFLDTMFLSYVRTEDYVSLSREKRNNKCDIVLELKQLLKSLKEKAVTQTAGAVTVILSLITWL